MKWFAGGFSLSVTYEGRLHIFKRRTGTNSSHQCMKVPKIMGFVGQS